MTSSTIFIGLISLWAAVCFIIAVIAFFQDDHKFGQYNWRISGVVGIFYFLSPILMPALRINDWLIERKENCNSTNG